MKSNITWICSHCGEPNYLYIQHPANEYHQCQNCYEGYTIITDDNGNILYIY